MIQNLLASALLILPLAPVEIPDIQSQVAERIQAAKTKESPSDAKHLELAPPAPKPTPPTPKPVQATTAPLERQPVPIWELLESEAINRVKGGASNQPQSALNAQGLQVSKGTEKCFGPLLCLGLAGARIPR